MAISTATPAEICSLFESRSKRQAKRNKLRVTIPSAAHIGARGAFYGIFDDLHGHWCLCRYVAETSPGEWAILVSYTDRGTERMAEFVIREHIQVEYRFTTR